MQLHANGIVESIISKLHLTKHNGLDKNQILLRDYELHELKAVLIEQVEDVYFKTRMSDLYPTTISVSVFHSESGGIRKQFTEKMNSKVPLRS
ncbi:MULTISPECIES: hypothetical protein [Staphylococcus]|uniref:Uncharacterized protein n=1 Tax=Staphylococcus ureilyticus TaxID=94138 RepID=A0AB34AHD7_STAUR|nr:MULTISPECIES: hypothetical protein [Staphylococcus]AVL77905.1 hypothetical protein CEQ12_09150 [Staphylococcus cohnii]MBL0375691.1 hypothetical protein [Staphylococcus sp. S75]MBL0383470.1 hypothetical protein [Staphylococcus sp. S59]MBL0402076.1 hypothetical protein [Staphylococcus sp. S36]MCT1913143.1 hypothetical protein [Staphylococcus ureilyticus]